MDLVLESDEAENNILIIFLFIIYLLIINNKHKIVTANYYYKLIIKMNIINRIVLEIKYQNYGKIAQIRNSTWFSK